MGIALLIGITGALGGIALGLGLFVLGKPPLRAHPVRKGQSYTFLPMQSREE